MAIKDIPYIYVPPETNGNGHSDSFFEKIMNKQFSVLQLAYLFAAFLALKIIWNIIVFIYHKIRDSILQKRAKLYRKNRDDQLQAFQIPTPSLDQDTLEKVLNEDVTSIKKLLAKGKVTSEDLVNIFAKRCQQFNPQLEAITHLKYEEAIMKAKECDKLRKEKSPLAQGLLFGIPISIKEIFDEKGYPSTVGCIQRLNYVPVEDGFIIQLLRKSGAIPLVRSNVPQCCFTFESVNRIYGRVKNPWDLTKMAGGSSGGEASVIAGRLCPIGLGSDQGGSIRIPAAMCGIYGFKPTSGRSLINGLTHYSEAFDGQTINKACAGPMGKSMDDIILLFKALCDPNILKEYNIGQIDPNLTILPIDENALNDSRKKRRFGYFKTLEVIDSCLAAQRAVDISIEKLRNQGHEVIEVEIPKQNEIIHAFLQNSFSDDMQNLKDILKGESFIEEYQMLDFLASLPNSVKKGLAYLMGALGEKRLKDHILADMNIDSHDYKAVVYHILQLRKEVLKVFDENKIEAIICPANATPALSHGSSADVADIVVYQFMWNILDFTCGVIPVTRVEEGEQHYENARVKDSISKKIDKYMRMKTEGLPIGVQVVAPPFKEEVCLNVMKIIDNGVQFYKQISFPQLEGEDKELEVVEKD
ncbi:hypothetical protein ABPG74_019789 [Tetrahymena malaccensis]